MRVEDIRETIFEHDSGSETFAFTSSERKWVNELRRLQEKYPEDVKILHTNDDGSIYGRFPASWIRIRPKATRDMTDEQREALRTRLEKARMKRIEEDEEGDIRADSGKDYSNINET